MCHSVFGRQTPPRSPDEPLESALVFQCTTAVMSWVSPPHNSVSVFQVLTWEVGADLCPAEISTGTVHSIWIEGCKRRRLCYPEDEQWAPTGLT